MGDVRGAARARLADLVIAQLDHLMGCPRCQLRVESEEQVLFECPRGQELAGQVEAAGAEVMLADMAAGVDDGGGAQFVRRFDEVVGFCRLRFRRKG